MNDIVQIVQPQGIWNALIGSRRAIVLAWAIVDGSLGRYVAGVVIGDRGTPVLANEQPDFTGYTFVGGL